MATRALPVGSKVVDRDAPVTSEDVDKLIAGGAVALGRCINHPKIPSADLTLAEKKMILGKRLPDGTPFGLFLYQCFPDDMAINAATGKERGELAAKTCVALEWDPAAPCFGDLEWNAANHSDAVDFLNAWNVGKRLHGPPDNYVSDLGADYTTDELNASGTRWWWRSGGRPKQDPSAGYVMTQASSSTEIGGVRVDENVVVANAPRGPFVVAVGDFPPLPVPIPAPAPPAPVPSPAPVPAELPPDPLVLPDDVTRPAALSAPPGCTWIDSAQATDEQIRTYLAAEWIPLAGLTTAPGTVDGYNEIVAPLAVEGGALEQQMDGMWSCALTWLGFVRARILRRCSPDTFQAIRAKAMVLWRPYAITTAMANVIAVAEAFGALRTSVDVKGGKYPRKGDSILINGGSHDVGGITSDVLPGRPFSTVEGGNQVTTWTKGSPRSYMAIKAGTRTLRADGMLVSSGGTASIYRWVDMVALVRAAGVAVLVEVPQAPAQPPPPPSPPPQGPPQPDQPPMPIPPVFPSGPPAAPAPSGPTAPSALLRLRGLLSGVLGLFSTGAMALEAGVEQHPWGVGIAAAVAIIAICTLVVWHEVRPHPAA